MLDNDINKEINVDSIYWCEVGQTSVQLRFNNYVKKDGCSYSSFNMEQETGMVYAICGTMKDFEYLGTSSTAIKGNVCNKIKVQYNSSNGWYWDSTKKQYYSIKSADVYFYNESSGYVAYIGTCTAWLNLDDEEEQLYSIISITNIQSSTTDSRYYYGVATAEGIGSAIGCRVICKSQDYSKITINGKSNAQYANVYNGNSLNTTTNTVSAGSQGNIFTSTLVDSAVFDYASWESSKSLPYTVSNSDTNDSITFIANWKYKDYYSITYQGSAGTTYLATTYTQDNPITIPKIDYSYSTYKGGYYIEQYQVKESVGSWTKGSYYNYSSGNPIAAGKYGNVVLVSSQEKLDTYYINYTWIQQGQQYKKQVSYQYTDKLVLFCPTGYTATWTVESEDGSWTPGESPAARGTGNYGGTKDCPIEITINATLTRYNITAEATAPVTATLQDPSYTVESTEVKLPIFKANEKGKGISAITVNSDGEWSASQFPNGGTAILSKITTHYGNLTVKSNGSYLLAFQIKYYNSEHSKTYTDPTLYNIQSNITFKNAANGALWTGYTTSSSTWKVTSDTTGNFTKGQLISQGTTSTDWYVDEDDNNIIISLYTPLTLIEYTITYIDGRTGDTLATPTYNVESGTVYYKSDISGAAFYKKSDGSIVYPGGSFESSTPPGNFTLTVYYNTGKPTITSTTFSYDATTHTISFDPDSYISGAVTFSGILEAKDASTYTCYANVNKGYVWSDTTTTTQLSYTWKINPATLTATQISKSFNYRETAQGPCEGKTYVTITGFQGEETRTDVITTEPSYTIEAKKSVGSYTDINLTGGACSSNYTLTLKNGTITIEPVITFTAGIDAEKYSGTMTPQDVTRGVEANINENEFKSKVEGLYFDCWKDSSGTTYPDKGTITIPTTYTGNTYNLTGVWFERQKTTINNLYHKYEGENNNQVALKYPTSSTSKDINITFPEKYLDRYTYKLTFTIKSDNLYGFKDKTISIGDTPISKDNLVAALNNYRFAYDLWLLNPKTSNPEVTITLYSYVNGTEWTDWENTTTLILPENMKATINTTSSKVIELNPLISLSANEFYGNSRLNDGNYFTQITSAPLALITNNIANRPAGETISEKYLYNASVIYSLNYGSEEIYSTSIDSYITQDEYTGPTIALKDREKYATVTQTQALFLNKTFVSKISDIKKDVTVTLTLYVYDSRHTKEKGSTKSIEVVFKPYSNLSGSEIAITRAKDTTALEWNWVNLTITNTNYKRIWYQVRPEYKKNLPITDSTIYPDTNNWKTYNNPKWYTCVVDDKLNNKDTISNTNFISVSTSPLTNGQTAEDAYNNNTRLVYYNGIYFEPLPISKDGHTYYISLKKNPDDITFDQVSYEYNKSTATELETSRYHNGIDETVTLRKTFRAQKELPFYYNKEFEFRWWVEDSLHNISQVNTAIIYKQVYKLLVDNPIFVKDFNQIKSNVNKIITPDQNIKRRKNETVNLQSIISQRSTDYSYNGFDTSQEDIPNLIKKLYDDSSYLLTSEQTKILTDLLYKINEGTAVESKEDYGTDTKGPDEENSKRFNKNAWIKNQLDKMISGDFSFNQTRMMALDKTDEELTSDQMNNVSDLIYFLSRKTSFIDNPNYTKNITKSTQSKPTSFQEDNVIADGYYNKDTGSWTSTMKEASDCGSACMGLCKSGCYSTCVGGCSTLCGFSCTSTCANECTGDCGSGCGTSCSANCGGTCGTGCGSQCDTTCYTNCSTGCAQSCGGACNNSCNDSCGVNCTDGCTANCKSTCNSGCMGQCTDACTGGCSAECRLNCSNKCTTHCQVTCGMECTGNCIRQCYGTCASGCTGGCWWECAQSCGYFCAFRCQNGCVHDCSDSCWTTCSTGCDKVCEKACISGCSEKCKVLCTTGCDADCQIGCTGSCQGNCGGNCTGYCADNCTHACAKSCTSNCGNACSAECTGQCNNSCTGTATNTSASCQNSCNTSCYNSCSKGCWGCQSTCKSNN